MSRLLVNCRKTPFASTLGVAHLLVNLCTSLADRHELVFVVDDPRHVDDSPSGAEIRAIAEVLTPDEVRAEGAAARRGAIELRPHHFQEAEFCDHSIVICLDLHVFDVPWKYGSRAATMQQTFRDNLRSADAVITNFPRTYYAVERVAGIHLPNLFLTEAPLLLDTRRAATATDDEERSRPPTLLYPAQLQQHKNHDALVRGVEELARRGREVLIRCPGSEFDEAITERLRSIISVSGVETCFEFPGRVSNEDLVQLYWDCDGVIVPSLAEGGAYVPLEAIAAGKPVAVHQIESARMHLQSVHGQVVWFDAGEPESTADAIEALMDADRWTWLDANARCRERLAEIDWATVAQRWDLVIDMIDHGGPRPVLETDPDISELVYRAHIGAGVT